MKVEKNKKNNWIMQSCICLTLLIIIMGSFVSPLLIYVALLFLSALSVVNMYRFGRYVAAAGEVKLEDVPGAAVEEPKQELTLEQKNTIEELVTYIKKNISEGHDLKTIVESLVQAGYTEEFVMDICVQMGIVEVNGPGLPDLGKAEIKPISTKKEPIAEVKAELPVIVEEKPPKKKTKKKKGKKKKAEKVKEEPKEEVEVSTEESKGDTSEEE